jgi:hypothetical protein
LGRRTEASVNQLAGDVHFLTAPLRFIWHSLLWLIFLLLAPALVAIVPVLAVKYASQDEIWFLKWTFGVLGPFAASFWFIIIAAMLRRRDRQARGMDCNRGVHLHSMGSMVFGFVVSAAAMFYFATNYDVCYNWTDAAWLTGASLALLGPFAILTVWRLLTRRIENRER